jgi:hypothetical protein
MEVPLDNDSQFSSIGTVLSKSGREVRKDVADAIMDPNIVSDDQIQKVNNELVHIQAPIVVRHLLSQYFSRSGSRFRDGYQQLTLEIASKLYDICFLVFDGDGATAEKIICGDRDRTHYVGLTFSKKDGGDDYETLWQPVEFKLRDRIYRSLYKSRREENEIIEYVVRST